MILLSQQHSKLKIYLLQLKMRDIIVGESADSEISIWLVLFFLIIYAILSEFLEHKSLPIHRSAIATAIGLVLGLIVMARNRETYDSLVRLNETIIFMVLLPPIIFIDGFTLKKGEFFRNIKYSIVFGVVGTFAFYMIIAGLIQLASDLDLLRDAKNINTIRNLSAWEVLLLSACLCSIDPIAAVEIVEKKKHEKLHAIMEGEAVFKDCVTIVLFRAILREQSNVSSNILFHWYTPFKILLNFGILIIGACLLGVVVGMLTTYMFKKMRFLHEDKGVTETTIMFLLAFWLYVFAQIIDLSGIISILVFGVVLNRYGTYNLSNEGKFASKSAFKFVCIICQGLLFLLMGMMAWQADWQKDTGDQISHSWTFCLIVIVLLLFTRAINIYLFGLIGNCFKKHFKMTKQELFVVFIGGLPKGATTFALFTSVELYSSNPGYARNEGLVIKSTIILIVIISCVFLNSVVSKILSKPLAKIGEHEQEPLLGHSLHRREQIQRIKSKFDRIDEQKIRPFFIYDYQKRKEQILRQEKEHEEITIFEEEEEETQKEGEETHKQQEHSHAVLNHSLEQNID